MTKRTWPERLGVAGVSVLLVLSAVVGLSAAFGVGTGCTSGPLDADGTPPDCLWVNWFLGTILAVVVTAILGMILSSGRHPRAALTGGLLAVLLVVAIVVLMIAYGALG